MATPEDLRVAIENGDIEATQAILRSDPQLANDTITWVLNQTNLSDPLHYVSDCCFNGKRTSGSEAALTRTLLAHGATVDGTSGRESPLIGAASLGVPAVAQVLVEAGADIHSSSIFGANALHWAAYNGLPSTVALLLHHGAHIDARCSEFAATPLFWAVQGFSRHGPERKSEQVAAAKFLIDAGADMTTRNAEGTSLLERAEESDSPRMRELIEASTA